MLSIIYTPFILHVYEYHIFVIKIPAIFIMISIGYNDDFIRNFQFSGCLNSFLILLAQNNYVI